MRFVSKSANYSAGNYRNAREAIGEPITRVVGGKTVTAPAEAYTVVDALPINFSQYGLLQSDIDAGLARWKTFPGLPLEEDRVTPANPVENGRIGVWDSVEWQKEHSTTDEDREGAEQMLLNSPRNGLDYFAIEIVKALKPWASYDEMHHSKIAAFATEAGCAPEALAYEQENKNRPSVVADLEAAAKQAESGEFVAA